MLLNIQIYCYLKQKAKYIRDITIQLNQNHILQYKNEQRQEGRKHIAGKVTFHP